MYRKRHLLSSLLTLSVFAFYLRTVAPTVVVGDAGELIVGAQNLGIVHPPGYPLWCMWAKLFTFLPYSNIGFRVNLSSVIAACAAIWLLALTFQRWFPGNLCVIMLLFLAFSPVLWSQAVTSEVYSLNLFMFAALFHLVTHIWERPSHRGFWLLLFGFGLSLGAHSTMVLALPGLLSTSRFYKSKAIFSLRFVVLCLLFLSLGISVQFYLPIRSATEPVLDWGHPDQLETLRNHLSRNQYGDFKWSRLNDLPERFEDYFSTTYQQYPLPIHLLALFGIVMLAVNSRGLLLRTMLFFIPLGSVYCVLLSGLLFGEQVLEMEVYYLPSFIFILLWSAFGGYYVIGFIKQYTILIDNYNLMPKVAIGALLTLALHAGISHYAWQDHSQRWLLWHYGKSMLASLERNALLFAQGDYEFFSAAYLQKIAGFRNDVIVVDRQTSLEEDIYGHPIKAMPDLLRTGSIPLYSTLKSSFFADFKPLPAHLAYRLLPMGQKAVVKYGWFEMVASPDDILRWRFYNYFERLTLANYFYFRAESRYVRGFQDAAWANFETAARITWDNKNMLNNLGSALAEKEQIAPAKQMWERALELDPEYTSPLNNLGQIVLAEGRPLVAVQYWQRSIAANPRQPHIHQQLREVLRRLQDVR